MTSGNVHSQCGAVRTGHADAAEPRFHLAELRASPTVPLGTAQRFTATGTFSDSSTQQLASVTWSSSNPAVVSVTDDASNPGAAYAVARRLRDGERLRGRRVRLDDA